MVTRQFWYRFKTYVQPYSSAYSALLKTNTASTIQITTWRSSNTFWLSETKLSHERSYQIATKKLKHTHT